MINTICKIAFVIYIMVSSIHWTVPFSGRAFNSFLHLKQK
jgi:hypothetical protein